MVWISHSWSHGHSTRQTNLEGGPIAWEVFQHGGHYSLKLKKSEPSTKIPEGISTPLPTWEAKCCPGTPHSFHTTSNTITCETWYRAIQGLPHHCSPWHHIQKHEQRRCSKCMPQPSTLDKHTSWYGLLKHNWYWYEPNYQELGKFPQATSQAPGERWINTIKGKSKLRWTKTGGSPCP